MELHRFYTLALATNVQLHRYDLRVHGLKQFPKDFLEKSKSGFGSPTGDWLRQSLRTELESYIEPELLRKQGIFKVDNVTKIVKDHLSKKRDSSFKVWAYYCFQKWYKFIYLNS